MNDWLNVFMGHMGVPVAENRGLGLDGGYYVDTGDYQMVIVGSAALFSFRVWAYGQRLDTLRFVERIFAAARPGGDGGGESG